MKTLRPKYSIVIPVMNGLKYLPSAIDSILTQTFTDYEIIISDDHSTDGTSEYLSTLKHPNVRTYSPPDSLSMTEHWEWALSHATGEWQMFLGQDDALQSYFFDLSEVLIPIAKSNKIRSIMSARAYYFWEGCEFVYGPLAVGYNAKCEISIRNFSVQVLKCLIGIQAYFELPEMYSNSLFHIDLLNEARSLQNGNVFCAHPQDANLAAIACNLDAEYLFSCIPLGWIGSSPKSAGMAISTDQKFIKSSSNRLDIDNLRSTYEAKVSNSKIQYHNLAGDFKLSNMTVYFWQALLQTAAIRNNLISKLLSSKLLTISMFTSVYLEVLINRNNRINRIRMMSSLLTRNNLRLRDILLFSPAIALIKSIALVASTPYTIYSRICFRFNILAFRSYKAVHNKSTKIDILAASRQARLILITSGWLTRLQSIPIKRNWIEYSVSKFIGFLTRHR